MLFFLQESLKSEDEISPESVSEVLDLYPNTTEAEIHTADDDEVIKDDSLSQEIEETSEALKKLLNTPTKGFSQLVFNEQSQHDIHSVIKMSSIDDASDDNEDDIPSLSPIKSKTNESHNYTLSEIPSKLKLGIINLINYLID